MSADNLMSDAVMVPREPTGAMRAAGKKAVGWNPAPEIHAVNIWNAMIAASTPVGGWEDISTAPDSAREIALAYLDGKHPSAASGVRRGSATWHEEFRQAITAAPPPPSVSTGSRPQEAVPTEQAEPAVVGAHEVIRCVADASTIIGWQAGEPAMEIAGMIVSFLAIHPEHVERFLKDGPELFIDGTIRPEFGSLTYRSIGGSMLNPAILRQHKGSEQ